MICQNAILSDEYMDYIWKADVNPPAEMDLLPYGVCAQYISPMQADSAPAESLSFQGSLY